MIKQEEFRQALGQFATGIAVATTLDSDGKPHGLTVNSFNSVSLDPPLVLWSLDKGSHQLGAFSNSGFYAVNVLSDKQIDISNQFAAFVEDRFEGVEWDQGETGAPLLSGALARIDCRVESIVEGGDHIILIGRVVSLETNEGAPLLYHGGAYKRIGDPM